MNKLYFGDNLAVIPQHIPPGSVDLVYLDPPFNSDAQYNVLYETPANKRETAQRSIFKDNWYWEEDTQACYEQVLAQGGAPAAILGALKGALHRSDMMAYLAMMSARLIEIRRVLKPTGSLYLHCDPTASHYLKIILDAIFGPTNFRNEVIWQRTAAHGRAKKWGPIHDVLLFYTMSSKYTWNRTYQAYDQSYVSSHYKRSDKRGIFQDITLDGPGRRNGSSGETWRGVDPKAKGRHWELPPDRALPEWFQFPLGYAQMNVQERLDVLDSADLIFWPERGKVPRFKRYLGVTEGNPIQDIITDIPPVNSGSHERIGYPTQKPVPLLRRIIAASSNPGDIVLDPFCGCGTTVEAAALSGRQWIGIDISYYGVRLIERRIRANLGKDYPIEVRGVPADWASAEALADSDRYGFQQWAVDELGCQLWNDGKKGSDRGIDGEMWFMRGPVEPGRLMVQVKAGKTSKVSEVRDFLHVLNRERAEMGVFFCRSSATADMRREANEAGQFRIGSATFPKLALVTLEDWCAGRAPRLPTPLPMRAAQDKTRHGLKRVKAPDAKQREMAFVFEGRGPAPREGSVLNPAVLPDEMLKSESA